MSWGWVTDMFRVEWESNDWVRVVLEILKGMLVTLNLGIKIARVNCKFYEYALLNIDGWCWWL